MEDTCLASRPRWLLTSLWIPLLLLWSCCCHPGTKGQEQELKIWQSPGPLSVSAGETLTLNCTLTWGGPPGGVKWHKGSDRSQIPIYSDKGQFAPRTTRVLVGSIRDFTIQISNIRPEDAGTYYCVKYRAGSPEKELISGPGTEVSVIATPSQPSISGPSGRVAAGSTAMFTCTSERFSPRRIAVAWLKDGRGIHAPQPTVLPEGESISYRVSSTVEVPLMKEDAKSELVCQISHSTLQMPLMEAFRLGDILRVPPRVQVEVKPSPPVQLNASVTVTCNAEGFFPQEVKLALFSINKTETGKPETATENRDGTFSLKSSLQIQASEEKNMSTFMCLVEHDSQPPINETTVLFIKPETEVNPPPSASMAADTKIAITVAVVCALLVLLVIAILYLIHARHNKGKDPTSVRLHESEKTSGGPNQDPDPNNVTYADLNFDKAPKASPPQVVEVSQQSEYASIQTGQTAASDENVTYADLDMVHLSKAPKRPAPKPEEVSSEYASVQVQSK